MVEINAEHVTGQPDMAGLFFGRGQAVDALHGFLTNPGHSRTSVAFIHGIPGAGKSTLARQALGRVIGEDDWLFSHKYDQFSEASPASFFVQALEDAALRLHEMPPQKREEIRRDLIDAVSPNAQLLVSLCARLGEILGPQPELIHLAPQENQIRLSFVLRKALVVLARNFGHVTLFLDDLQWADAATISVLTDLIADGSVGNLSILACYRSGEGEKAAELLRTVQMVGNPVFDQEIGALDDSDIASLLQSRLKITDGRAKELSAEIRNASNGTPLAALSIVDLLQSEQGDGLGDDVGLSAIRTGGQKGDSLPDALELAHRRLSRLGEMEQDLLTISAYVGERIDVPLLADMTGQTETDLRPYLNQLTQQGILNIDGDAYRFAHDTFQRAAYDRETPLHEKRSLFRKTAARAFEDRFEQTGDSSWLFRSVGLFNLNLDMLEDVDERRGVAELNRKATRAALDSGGSARALKFASAGLSLTPEDAWSSDYAGMRQAHLDAAEAAYLSNDITRFDALIDTAAEHATSPVEWAEAYLLRLQQRVSSVRYEEALDIAVEMLNNLEAPLPRTANKAQVATRFVRTMILLRGQSTDDLYNLPHMTDARAEKELETLMLAASAAYFAEPNLFPLIVFRMVRLSVDYGNSRLSAFGWVCYGLALCSVVGNVRAGYDYGVLALRMTEAFGADELRARVHMLFNTFVRHWSESRAAVAGHLREGELAGLASGDLEFATYCGWHRCNDAFWSGAPLDEVEAMVSESLALGREYNQQKVSFLLAMMQEFLAWLKDPEGSLPDDAAHEAFCQEHKDYTSLCYVKLFQALRHMLSGDSAACLRATAEIDKHYEALQGQFYVPYYILLRGLAAATEHSKTPARGFVRAARSSRRKLQSWSNRGSTDVAPLADLSGPTELWTSTQPHMAAAGFDKVITAARAGDAPLWCGVLAARSLAKLYENQGSDGQKDWALNQAGELKELWGIAPQGAATPTSMTAGKGFNAIWSSAFPDRESWLEEACPNILAATDATDMWITLEQDAAPVSLLHARLSEEDLELFLAADAWAPPEGVQPVPLSQPDGDTVQAWFKRRPQTAVGMIDTAALEPMLMPLVSELRREATHRRLRHAEEQRVALQTAYGRFVPGYLLTELGRSDFADIRVGDFGSNQMTVMFCDMRGATGIMEKIGPQASLELFNELFIAIESEVLRAGGYIDSFLGDAVLALFDSTPDVCVGAMSRVAHALDRVHQEIIARGLPAPGFGLGASTGEVVFGAVGGLNQIRVGAIGDTLNLASRIESLTKRYGSVAMIAETTFDQLEAPGDLRLRQVDFVRVVGRKKPVRLFELVDAMPPDRGALVWENIATYEDALLAFYGRKFKEAREGFDRFLASVPDDIPATQLRDRAAEFAEHDPGPAWDGVHVLHEK